MKKLLYSFVILALIVACGKDSFTVKGTIAEGETYPEDTLVYLLDGDEIIDSTAVKDGAFILKAPANPERYYNIWAYPNSKTYDWYYGLIAEPGTFPVTFSADSKNCSVKNAPLNKKYNEYRQSIRDITNDYRQKAAELADDAEDEMESLYEETMGKLKDLSLDAIGKNANNYIAKAALQNIIYDLDLDQLKDIVGKCGKFVRDDESVSRIITCKEAEIATAEGQPFVDFAGKTPEGADIKLSDYVGKGKWVLTDFWASWCGPCMREVPNVKKVFETYEGDKFMVLGVAVWESNGDNSASARKMEQMDMKWHQIFVGDDHTPTDSYGIVGIPTMILFAPDGTIYKRGDVLRGESMIKTVAEALAQ